MAKAKKIKQISFTLPNRVGLLSEISSAITKAKVNINAVCGYEMDNMAYFMLVTESYPKTKKIISSMTSEFKEEDVIAVEMPNKPGALDGVTKRIADAGIDIHYMYGTAFGGRSSTCVFKTADDKKAIKVINK
ncbi:MAG: hypothetical protein A3D21_02600 [Nitrospirae bacterium RIFCSPHIGHO2_02_FULL_42_12]|nr:MAG: hypothetical protein A3D21_02600 [Nitrospirae bacterium RIFCSPHIGHO2_02_FULL_42_12]